MAPPASKPPLATPPGRAVGRSRSSNDKAAPEESIYNIGGDAGVPAQPRVRTYAAAPTSPTGANTATKPRMHVDSSQISEVLNPVHGVRDAQVRKGIKPTDHARSNAMAVREVSQMNALRKAAEADMEKLQGQRPLSRSSSMPTRRGPSPPAGPVIPSVNSSVAAERTSARDFVAENRLGAAAVTRLPKQEGKADDGLKYLQKRDFGRVPTYLLERKLELAQAAADAERAREAALVPPGMRLLPEDERQETLAILARNKQDVERALQALPIIIETPSAIRRKNELEQRLREIEDAVKVFSRPKVLVQL